MERFERNYYHLCSTCPKCGECGTRGPRAEYQPSTATIPDHVINRCACGFGWKACCVEFPIAGRCLKEQGHYGGHVDEHGKLLSV